MRRAARIDNTAKALTAYLKDQPGVVYWPINADVDGLAWVGTNVAVIDWKSPGGALTDTQAKMVAKGCRIWFLTTTDHVDAMLRELRK